MPLNSSPRATLARLAPLIAAAATLLAYAAVSSFQFVYDDEGQIVHDLFVQQWRFVPAYFTSHVWQWVFPHVAGNYYRPLFLLWLLLNFKAFGLHAAGWHLAALGLHLVVTWQVYRLAMRLLQNQAAAVMAALLFGLHPVHIEAVAWVSGATEPLVAIFILAALLSYIAYREDESRAGYAWTLLWFVLGLLTKETAVLVPPLLFAYDLIVRNRRGTLAGRARAALIAMAPMAAIFAVYLGARHHALGALSQRAMDVSAKQNLLTIPSLLVFYARLLLWPAGLSAFYDTPYVTDVKAALLPAVVCLAAGVVLFFVLWRSRSRVAVFATVLLILPLLPVMKLDIFLRGEIAHDRYLYLPSIGFVLLAGMLVRRLGELGLQRVAYAGCALLAVLYFAGTMTQSLYWADDLVLYARGTQIAPNNLIARTDLANELLKRGDRPGAMQQYRAVLQKDPFFWLARYNLGYAEYSANDCVAAARDLELAGRQNPSDPETFFYLGQCRARLGDREQGLALMRHGIELDPRMPNFRAALADELARSGDPGELRAALELYRAEASGNPQHPTAAQRAAEVQSRLAGR